MANNTIDLGVLGQLPDLHITLRLDDAMAVFEAMAAKAYAKVREERDADEREVLVTPDEASERLGVTRQTLCRWDKTGYLVPVKFGRKALYKQGDIMNLLNQRRTRP